MIAIGIIGLIVLFVAAVVIAIVMGIREDQNKN